VKALVVSYSNSGTTSLVAAQIARQLGADVEAILETKPRPALLVDGKKSEAGGGAIVKAVFASIFGLGSAIVDSANDPSRHDLVVVGTPVWAGGMTPAVRSYLKRHRKSLPRVAFFCSAGDPSKLRAFNQMQRVAGKAPVATLALKSDDARSDACRKTVADFVSQLGQG